MSYVEELRRLVGTRPLILPGSTILVINDNDEVLLQERIEPKNVWGLPGGLMELGESTEDVAKRELFEETALVANELTLLGIYSGANYFVRLNNGDEFYSVTTAYICHKWEGEMKNSPEEGLNLQFFPLQKLPIKIVGSHEKMINDYIKKE